MSSMIERRYIIDARDTNALSRWDYIKKTKKIHSISSKIFNYVIRLLTILKLQSPTLFNVKHDTQSKFGQIGSSIIY